MTVTISIGSQDTVFQWGLAVSNRSGFALHEVRFPTLRGLGSNLPGSQSTDFVAVPYNSGVRRDSPRRQRACDDGWTNYPGGGLAIQLLTYCDGQGRGGLYLSSEDCVGYRKSFWNVPMSSGQSFSTYILHYPDGRTGADGKWELPYSIAAGPFAGDSYDAAKIYRKWMAATQHWPRLSQRQDIPPWFLDLSVWYQGWPRWDITPPESMDAYADKLINIRRRLGEDYGFHWYMWFGTQRHDYAYPQYLPAQPGFKEAVARVQQQGVHVMPYVNIQLFDTTIDMWKMENAEQWASRNVHGELNRVPNLWEPPRRAMVNMCQATAYWQDKLAAIYESLVKDYGVHAIYLDELHMYPFLCYAGNHGHTATGGGDFFTQGIRELIRKTKARSGLPQLAVTGEACTETYADLISGQLSGLVDTDYEPLYILQAAMNDRTVQFGMQMHPTEMDDMVAFAGKVGFSFVNGRQLLWADNVWMSDLTDAAHAAQMDFLIRLAQARRAGKEFLLYGEFLRKPRFLGAPRHDLKWKGFADSEPKPITLDSVLGSVYVHTAAARIHPEIPPYVIPM